MVISQGNAGLFASFKHSGLDAPIFMNEESAGTRRFIDIFPRLHHVLETGSVAIFDEIDADMHPLLMPEIFRWFNDEKRNPHRAQLFFTAHNPALLDEGISRTRRGSPLNDPAAGGDKGGVAGS